jgi:tyrosine-protein phosphatase SIW14
MFYRVPRYAFVLLFAFSAQYAGAADQPVIHIRNFGQVNEHLFRGAEPSVQGLRDLAKMHVLLDLDLREAGQATETERQEAEKLGIKYVNVPLRALRGPTPDEMKRILSLIYQDDTGKMFVHCWRGKDRTGTVIACYRIEHDGWDSRKAESEAIRYGMSWMQRGMRSFILAFKPIDLPPPLQAEK